MKYSQVSNKNSGVLLARGEWILLVFVPGGLNLMLKYLAQCLAHVNHSINVGVYLFFLLFTAA